MSGREWDVLGLGVVAVDDIYHVERYPPPDSKMPVKRRERQGGGLAGTALVAVARLGARAAYAGVLGEDDLARYTIDEFAREGVDCRPVLRREGALPVHSVIIVDMATAQRVILYTYEGVQQRPPEDVSEELVARTSVLFVDHSAGPGALRAIALAHRVGVSVVADLESDAWPEVPELVEQVDHLIVGVQFARRYTAAATAPEALRALARAGRACTVVTVGDQGCWYCQGLGEPQSLGALRVPVVDTTGCGDVFHGAYAAAIARGEDVPAALGQATVAAGLKAMHVGGRAGIPRLEEVDARLRELRLSSTADHRPWPG